MIAILNYIQKNGRVNKRFEKTENSIQKHKPLKPENQFIKRMIKIQTRAQRAYHEKTDIS